MSIHSQPSIPPHLLPHSTTEKEEQQIYVHVLANELDLLSIFIYKYTPPMSFMLYPSNISKVQGTGSTVLPICVYVQVHVIA